MNNLFRKKLLILSLFCLGIVNAAPVIADQIIMTRIKGEFPEAMNQLQESVVLQGYQVSRVQRVDVGLTKTGHKTDAYRLVFFGKYKEIKQLTKEFPTLAPYLPLKIVIFAEGDETLILASDPRSLKASYPDKKLHKYFDVWEKDIRSIMDKTYTRMLE
jgi:uncharacterized protein (DUF302 family)